MHFPFKGLVTEMGLRDHAQEIVSNGMQSPCSIFELNFMECMESYGMINGKEKCRAFNEDFTECKFGYMAIQRKRLMDIETAKKVLRGEKKFEDRHMKTDYHAYMDYSFYP